MRLRQPVVAAVLVTLASLLCLTGGEQPALAAPSRVIGSGSTYVNLAMNQWKSQASSAGLPVEYTPNGSPSGMSFYASNGSTDFAGTEAEFSSLQIPDSQVGRGFQYVPDVAGATAIMYNVRESSGQKVDYLHLDPATVARIFIGKITRWSDPAISANNKGIVFPDQPIRVVLRSSKSGTTALFYDFVASVLGAEYTAWFTANGCGDVRVRPVLIECANPAAVNRLPTTVAFADSQQIAQFVGNDKTGAWSIGFDEFSYARQEKVPTAWIRNGSGAYVLPYAENISAAMESAKLRADLSQELSGVYGSRNPKGYPISAYSYITLPCATSSDRPTCKGAYPDPGKTETMGRFLSYVACDGQTSMAALGYSPLPPNLSQEMANAVARLTGAAPAVLSAGNCSNPRFRGSLGAGSTSPCDPFIAGCAPTSSAGGGGGGTTPGKTGGTAAGGQPTKAPAGTTPTAATAADAAAAASAAAAATDAAVAGGEAGAVGGGSGADKWRKANPVAFNAPAPDGGLGARPLLLLLGAVIVPTVVGAFVRRRRAT